ncbi:MAG: CoA transferase [Chloroflexi bacterium]|nr:CoA transferase [Chloroflexota bacterium]
MSAAPLHGIRVVEFSTLIAGPLTGTTLGDYGAEVIKIEGVKRADQLRFHPPKRGNVKGGNSARFAQYNHSKLSLTLDMNEPGSIEAATALIAQSDVIVENYSPRVLKGWGLTYERLRAVRPDLVMISMSALGQTGPHAHHIGLGAGLAARGGFVHVSGWPDREPCLPVGAYTDYIGPPLAVAAVLAALERRRRTGQGAYIDLSQLEAPLLFVEPAILDYQVSGRIATREGNRSDAASPHGAFRCKGDDAWCAIAVHSDADWAKLCAAIGRGEMARDARFATLQARRANEAEATALIEGWTGARAPDESMRELQAAGVEAGAVHKPGDLHSDPQLAHRTYLASRKHPDGESFTYHAPPFHISTAPADIRRFPYLGEHNGYVLKDLLGRA